jgi:hypothetical protein
VILNLAPLGSTQALVLPVSGLVEESTEQLVAPSSVKLESQFFEGLLVGHAATVLIFVKLCNSGSINHCAIVVQQHTRGAHAICHLWTTFFHKRHRSYMSLKDYPKFFSINFHNVLSVSEFGTRGGT